MALAVLQQLTLWCTNSCICFDMISGAATADIVVQQQLSLLWCSHS
jgi:hypothetical protein